MRNIVTLNIFMKLMIGVRSKAIKLKNNLDSILKRLLRYKVSGTKLSKFYAPPTAI